MLFFTLDNESVLEASEWDSSDDEMKSKMKDSISDLIRMGDEAYDDLQCPEDRTCSPVECMDWSLFHRSCDCNPSCIAYGTCCPAMEQDCHLAANSDNSGHSVMTLDIDFYIQRLQQVVQTCEYMPDPNALHYFVVTKCARPFKPGVNMTEVDLCEGFQFKTLTQLFPVFMNDVLYRNAFCAACNGLAISSSSSSFEKVFVECDYDYLLGQDRKIEEMSGDEVLSAISEGSCSVSYDDLQGVTYTCKPEIVRTCNASYLEHSNNYHQLETLCGSYASYVAHDEDDNVTVFANVHCAMCNGIPLKQLSCIDSGFSVLPETDLIFGGDSQVGYLGIPTFFMLMDFSGYSTNIIDSIRICHYQTEVLDIGTNLCMERRCHKDFFSLDHSKCLPNSGANFKPANNSNSKEVKVRLFFEDETTKDLADRIQYSFQLHLGEKFRGNFTRHGQYVESILQSPKDIMDVLMSFARSEDLEHLLNDIDVVSTDYYSISNNFISAELLYISEFNATEYGCTKMEDAGAKMIFDRAIYDSLDNFILHAEHLRVFLPSLSLSLEPEFAPIHIHWEKDHSGHWINNMTAKSCMTIMQLCSDAGVDCRAALIQSSSLQYESILTIVFSAISIGGILLTFLIHTLMPLIRNYLSLLVRSVMASVLGGHLLFLVGSSVPGLPTACSVMAMAQHYMWLVSFFFMSALCFETHQVLTQVHSDPKTKQGTAYYMLYSLGVPSVIVLVCVVLHNLDLFQYGSSQTCWIIGRLNVALSFGLPVGLILLSNVIIFTITYLRLRKQMDIASKVSNAYSNKMRFVLCIKMTSALILGWVFGFMGNIPELFFLRYAFIPLSCLNGLFISLCFTCNPRLISQQMKRSDLSHT